ncbi:MAG: ACT domain-containing protein [Candidatus Limiplasma sp.]|nr:ACT domain-containing protein [Candidatus Limiplasma sp.]
MQKALVSVMGVDRPGIIAKVSTSLFEQNINILEISQTILGGYFTMMMMVDISNAAHGFSDIAAALTQAGEAMGVVVQIQRAELFDAMHRV